MSMDEQKELVQVAMQIILHAGDARNHATEALKAAKQFDFDLAEEKMKLANECITLAHKAQTETIQETIQNEMSGEKYEYSMLFAHAQDTLMTIMSEINMSTEMIDILKIIKSNM